MSPADIDRQAKIIWDYMQMHEKLAPCDGIFCLCSLDTRVAERAAQLFMDDQGKWLIFSGGKGKLTQNLFDRPEATVFTDIAIKLGVPEEKIIAETLSTNTGENIRFTYELLRKRNLKLQSLLLVQKPYMERRTYATFKKQWPSKTEFLVTSPQIEYDAYFNQTNPKDLVVNIMVGDLQRISEYPKLGFQIEQEIPGNVWAAYKKLVAAGFNKHLLKSS